jgi:hypothetical protein
MKRRVPMGKGADADRRHARVLEARWKALELKARPELPTRAVQDGIRIRTAVVHDSVVNSEAPGQQRRSTGQARHIRSMNALEADGRLGESVNVRAGSAMIAVATEVVGPKGVDVDIEQPHAAIKSRKDPARNRPFVLERANR